MDTFEGHSAEENALQNEDAAEPFAPSKPAFPNVDFDSEFEQTAQTEDRARAERGNRGPDEEPGSDRVPEYAPFHAASTFPVGSGA